MIRLMAADPFLPLIGALLPAIRRRGRSVLQSRNGENERSLGVVTVPQILLPPKLVPVYSGEAMFPGAYGGAARPKPAHSPRWPRCAR
jgi:hypothetical protein